MADATFARPTLPALREQARQGIAARLPGTDPALRRSVLGVLADAFAGLVHHQYGFLDWQVRQLIPDTAEGAYLDRWCRIVGITRKAATRAAGTVTLLGTTGAVLPAGARLVRADGVAYVTGADATLASGTATVAVTAVDGGDAGNAGAGAQLALSIATPGILGTAAVTAGGLTGGGPAETDADLRERLRLRLATPPQGGAASDYVAWALAVPGVTRAWVYPQAGGPGTVHVAFVMDGRPNIIPLSADVSAVADHIAPRRPVTADVTVFAPTGQALNVTVTGLSPDTAAVRVAIAAEVRAQILRDAAPGGTIRRSRLVEAISRAAGENFHTLTAPSADVTHAAGTIATPGTVTFA